LEDALITASVDHGTHESGWSGAAIGRSSNASAESLGVWHVVNLVLPHQPPHRLRADGPSYIRWIRPIITCRPAQQFSTASPLNSRVPGGHPTTVDSR
jgi:hypothetical protein